MTRSPTPAPSSTSTSPSRPEAPAGNGSDNGKQPGRRLGGDRATRAGADLPGLVAGLEFLGAFDGSGYESPPMLIRKPDGQVVQVAEPLYRLAEGLDRRDDPERIAASVSESFGRPLGVDDLRVIVDEKLVPLGIVEGRAVEADRVAGDPMLALRAKVRMVPASFVRVATVALRPLFWPPIVAVALAGLVVLDVWLFGMHGVAQPLRDVLYEPAMVLVVLGLVVASAAFHEFGHATGCAYGGGKPGVMGAGFYVIWPVFYTDVTDAYRLSRGARLRTDLGGVYFNVLFVLAVAGLYALTGAEALLFFVVLMHLEIVHQFLPFVRLDGYYVVADLTGVPDLFARIGPILRSLAWWRPADPSVTGLKTWVRFVVTGWVLTIVPLLLYLFAIMMLSMPRVVATAWDAMGEQWSSTMQGFADGDPLAIAAGIVGMLALLLPLVGLPLSLLRATTRGASLIWKRTEGRPVRRTIWLGVEAALLTALVLAWLPGQPARYEPISPTDRGTFGESIRSIAHTSGLTSSSPATGSTPATSVDPQGETTPTSSPNAEPSPSSEPTPTSSPSPTGTAEPSVSPSAEPTPSPSATAVAS